MSRNCQRRVRLRFVDGTTRLARCSAAGKDFLVVGVRADPEPDDLAVRTTANRSVADSDSGRPDRLRRMDLLETQTPVMGVRVEEPVSRSRLLSNRFGKAGEGFSKSPRRVGSQSFSGSSSFE